MNLLIFLQGTLIMPHSGLDRTRVERVEQPRVGADRSLRDPGTYVPIGGAVRKVGPWYTQGAHIEYLTAHRHRSEVARDTAVLGRHRFPSGRVLARSAGMTYGEVVGRALPDLLIEEDCERIGAGEVAYSQLGGDLRSRIRSILVPEFGDIDRLPGALSELADLASSAGSRPT